VAFQGTNGPTRKLYSTLSGLIAVSSFSNVHALLAQVVQGVKFEDGLQEDQSRIAA
jgi:hypothetical protein